MLMLRVISHSYLQNGSKPKFLQVLKSYQDLHRDQ